MWTKIQYILNPNFELMHINQSYLYEWDKTNIDKIWVPDKGDTNFYLVFFLIESPSIM